MKKFRKVSVSEQELEDLVRCHAEEIEAGLTFVDHQKAAAGGRLDVLLVDSGKALVVAELKVTEDDGMLIQCLDYYDDVSTHVEFLARSYKAHAIDPAQEVRLFLIAPTFSQTLVNRCKWFKAPISLFTYFCVKAEGEDDIVPFFTEQQIPVPPEPPEVATIEGHLNSITDTGVRAEVAALVEEIRNWKPGNTSVDPIKYSISMKVNGHLFAYLHPRRKHYIIGTYDADDNWKDYPVKGKDDLAAVESIMKAAMERTVSENQGD